MNFSFDLSVFSQGRVLLSRQTVEADTVLDAKAMVIRQGAGAIIVNTQTPIFYFSDPMEEEQLSDHAAGSYLE